MQSQTFCKSATSLVRKQCVLCVQPGDMYKVLRVLSGRCAAIRAGAGRREWRFAAALLAQLAVWSDHRQAAAVAGQESAIRGEKS